MDTTLKDRLAEVEALLDKFEEEVGLPKYIKNRVTCEYLDILDFKKYTEEELYSIVAKLASFGTHIQRAINRITSRLTFANNNLGVVVAQESDKYGKYAYEERKNSVIANNEYAAKLNSLWLKAQMHLDRLNYLPTRIEYQSKQIGILLNNRRRKGYEENKGD